MTDTACHYCNHDCDLHKEDSGCECSVAGCDCNLTKVVESWSVVLENTLDEHEKNRIADKACECRVMRAIDVIRSELDAATLTNFGWERLDDAPGYRRRCKEHKEFKRVGSIDICIKHRFRGTAEQPGCPECAASGDGSFFLKLESQAGTQLRMNQEAAKLLEAPIHSTWISYRDKPLTFDEALRAFGFDLSADFDDITEPSTVTKRADEPVPAWLSSEAPEATSKACGCTTISGITFSCLACAKGGG